MTTPRKKINLLEVNQDDAGNINAGTMKGTNILEDYTADIFAKLDNNAVKWLIERSKKKRNQQQQADL